MKYFKQKMKYMSNALLFACVSVFASFQSAFADVPPEVETAFDLAQADAISMGTILITATVGVIGVLWIYSMIKRGRNV